MFTFIGFLLLLLAGTNSPALKNSVSYGIDVLRIQNTIAILTFYKSHDGISIGRKG